MEKSFRVPNNKPARRLQPPHDHREETVAANSRLKLFNQQGKPKTFQTLEENVFSSTHHFIFSERLSSVRVKCFKLQKLCQQMHTMFPLSLSLSFFKTTYCLSSLRKRFSSRALQAPQKENPKKRFVACFYFHMRR